MTALCCLPFRRMANRWPTPEATEKAKQWVEEQSCPFWRDGWLMVDGTLVPLWSRPGFFGNTFFDRKSNYSLNVQVRVAASVWCEVSKCHFSSYPHQTSILLTMVLVYQVASMTLLLCRKHAYHRSIRPYLNPASGYGVTQHTHCKHGVKHHIKSKYCKVAD